MIKKIILSTIIALFTLLSYSQSVKQHGKLKVEGTQLVDKKGKPVVLRGMSLGWHNWWPRFYNAEAVKWLNDDWKCSVLRIAVGVEPHGAYLDEPERAKAQIKVVVGQALKEDMYVIIDWHSHNIKLKEAKAFFTEMASLYGRYPNVIYEIFNEPEKDSWQDIRAYSDSIISTIRKVDKDNIILVGTPRWDQGVHEAADAPLTRHSNIMYTLHFYADSHRQWLRDRATYALNKGLPLFISECAGMEASGKGSINEAEWAQWMNWAEKNKVSWVVWAVADKDETCSALYKKASSTGGWNETDLSPWGTKARSLLRSFSEK